MPISGIEGGVEAIGMMSEMNNLRVPVDIINARVHGYQTLQRIEVNTAGVIQNITPMTDFIPSSGQFCDVAGDWVSLGGVDLQINGALGLAFPDLVMSDNQKLQEICDYLWKEGVDGFLPTLVTTSVENMGRSLSVLSQFQPTSGAKILGVHLEGPFLNPQKRGAHPGEYLLPLTLSEVKRVLGDYAQIVKVITLAPELDETGDVIPYLKALGITVSLGHSQATETQARQAFEQGATMVTHAFNAMPGLHHRQPGLLGAALTYPEPPPKSPNSGGLSDRSPPELGGWGASVKRSDTSSTVFCGFIADGEHISPTMLKILLRAGQNQLFLVSDALSPLGLPDGIYPWDSRQIEVKQGTARLADGTLSGTTRSLLTGVQNLVHWGVAEPGEAVLGSAIALATVAPRVAIGLSASLLGQSAHLLRWSLDADGMLNWQRL
jgi:N-acetylglucosamine-6-phosphate deacetylase